MDPTTQTADVTSDLRILTNMVRSTIHSKVAEHHASDAKILAVCSDLDSAFNRLHFCLDHTTDDDEMLDRLGSITVGPNPGQETRFQQALFLDLNSIDAQLERIGHEGTPMVKANLKDIKGVLDRYSEVIEFVRMKNTECAFLC
jgi:hypothetical protein